MLLTTAESRTISCGPFVARPASALNSGAPELIVVKFKEGRRYAMSWYGSHSFLNAYIRENKCRRIMEIGVFNGENARTMVEVAMKNFPPEEVEYYGFDFFNGNEYHKLDQELKKTGCKFELFKGDTIETLPEVVVILPKMDLIFIDGGKSYREAESDWENSTRLMHDETAVFVHNYEFSGVKRMVNNIPRDEYQVKIIHPRSEGQTALIKRIDKETAW